MLAVLMTAILAGPPLYQLDQPGLDAYVHRLAQDESGFDARLTRVLNDSVGTPYQDGPLGEGPGGKYDTDPLIDFGRVDCVTYVEQTVAAATARDYDRLFADLQRIRYRNGLIDYEQRNHFFISDWIANNAFCREVTGDLGVDTATVTRTISRKGFFDRVNAPGLGLDTPDRDVTLRYIPSAAADRAEQALPSPSLIVFIGKVDWLFALHCGIYARDDDGVGRLYHASSKHGKVVAMDLSDYVTGQGDRYLGFAAYKIEEPNFDDREPAARD